MDVSFANKIYWLLGCGRLRTVPKLRCEIDPNSREWLGD